MVVFNFMEVWKKIEGFENYEVSNYGNVKRLDSLVYQSGKIFKYKGRILKQENVKEYKRVSLSKGKIIKRFQVHRLVSLCFIQNTDNKPCVNHINGIKSDNRSVNLEWVSYSENEKHSYDFLNKINPIRKLTSEQANYIKSIGVKGRKGNVKELSLNYNVTNNVILNILNNKHYV
jgi:hypothetical protein